MIDCRMASASDAALIHQLMIRAFAEYQNSYAPSSALQETVASIRDAMEEGEQVIIAFDETLPVGMVRFILRSDAVYFYRLSVVPEKQGHGIAKIILNNLEEFARENGKNKAVCRVRKNVKRNIRLYQSVGFCIYDHEVVHKSGGINIEVVSMQKQLI